EYQFIWSHHHLILDGWSASLVVREVFTTYEALLAGRDPHLPLPRPFRDYIGWLAKRDRAIDETFWRKNLAGISQATPIGSAHAGGLGEPAADYAEREARLSAGATAALQEIARQHRLTLNCLVQGAWALLLSRISGDRDVVFGSTVSGRPPELSGVEAMVGVFINALPVRARVPSSGALIPWLQEFMAQQVEREQHAWSSLVDIQAWSGVRPGEPLFESLVIFENYPLRESEDGRIGIADVRLFRRANFPLTLVVSPEAGLHLAISFDTSRFHSAAIERILDQLRFLLEQIAANPENRLWELSLLTSEERERLARWNDTTAPYPAGLCIHDVFSSCVRRAPDAAALVFEQQTLTYRSLNARANQLARHLRQRGVGPETLVGVCLERSLDMVIAVLGILKAGGAWLPLDPSYPQDRLAFMIEDSAVPVLVTHAALEDLLPSSWAQMVMLDADQPAIASHPETDFNAGATAENLAYVIYTSGSTGRPKGVQVTHRGLCNLAEAQQELFTPLAGGRVLQFASLSFDASVWEIVMGLASGAALHLGASESLLPGPALTQELLRGAITHVTLPPSALAMLPQTALTSLHTLIVAGEACSPGLVDCWSQDRRFVNAYGPTESTVCATAWVCGGNEPHSPPIGWPLPNTHAWVLDRNLNPLPPGVAGELYVGGVNLARGYLQRWRLTAERFVPDCLSGAPGARLYNTGDIASFRDDGSLVFLGRADHQVKIRGHRIELGEIENVLEQAAGVRQSVVVAHLDSTGNNSLAAYVVADANAADAPSLRNHLRRHLPEYMLPGTFIFLESLPLSPNGKVDRLALPAPDAAAAHAGTRAWRPPSNPVEQKLVAIWEDVLDIHPVGVDDDFFLLGGHSLLAVRLMASIEEQFGQHVPMAALFKSPTVAELATRLCSPNETSVWSSLIAVQPAGSGTPLFFVPGGGGNVVYLHALARHLGKERPFYGLQARGLDGLSDPHGSIEEMAAAYVTEVLEAQPEGPYYLGGHSSGSWVAFEMARLLQTRGHEVAMVAILDTPAPLPETKTSDVDDDEALYLTKIARLIERWAGRDLDITYEALRPLAEAEQMAYLEERLKTVDILPPQAGRDQVHGLVQVFKASTRNCTRYAPRGLYNGPVALLRAAEIHIEDTGIRMNLRANDETWGWNQLAQCAVDVRIIPGDHVTMMAEPHVRELASELSACIGKAERVGLMTKTVGAGVQ
ncbi:MAG TPA: amino acid adenylation domain-containing protein, partial [Bryobacteraceae bacterium]